MVVIDTETNGLDWKRNNVVGYVLAWGPKPEETAYYPVAHDGGNMNRDMVEAFIGDILRNPNILKVAHNLKFDLHMLKNEGIDLGRNTECTMINQALINENSRSFGLEACAESYGVKLKGRGSWLSDKYTIYHHLASKFGGEPKPEQMDNFWRLSGDDPHAIEYAAGDGTTTWQLWEEQQKALDDENLRDVWEVEKRITQILFKIERRGIKIDEEMLEKFKKWCSHLIEEIDENLPPGFNVRSGPQVKEYMENCGHFDYPRTKKGNPSFTEEWLITKPEGRIIIDKRKLTNIFNSFYNPLVERHIFNGRVHSNYNQSKMDDYGVVSGRLSSNDPNMQQVPKHNKVIAPRFRSVFTTDPGYIWSSNDYVQQEYVLFAEYSRSPVLVAGYNATPQIDIHTQLANKFGLDRDTTAKRMNFSKISGMGIPTMAKTLGVSEEEARKRNEEYNEWIPEANKNLTNSFYKMAERRAKARGYVLTILGRRRRLEYKFAYKAMNQIIQGGGADIAKLKMVEIDDYFESEGGDAFLNLQCHDEIDWEYPEGRDDINKEALRIMGDFSEGQKIHLKHVRLDTESNTGAHWGQASFPKFDWNDPWGENSDG